MNKRDLTDEQMISVPCPTCGMPVGKGCVLYAGDLRPDPHGSRKLAAVDALEEK
jgi:hypothetical protein